MNQATLLSTLPAALTIASMLSLESLPAQGGNIQERTRKVVKQFDKDEDGRLNAAERAAAREWLKANPRDTGPGRGRGGRGGRGRGGRGGQPAAEEAAAREPIMIAKDEVAFYPESELYDTTVLRTIFLDFENPEWMAELDDFYRTDVEVPATMTVDGKSYEAVGVGFRGNSSYFTLGDKKKKSMNISIDALVDGQRVHGYKTLNLLNCHADPSYLREVIHSTVANQYFPVLKASPVRLVINGESWGLYA
ncbi:MAG: CotH kinase family protein, partial [Planctomycetota bacterium]